MAVRHNLEKEKPRENMSKKSGAKAILIEQEVKLARGLAGNSKQIRDKALKSLKKWFQNPVNFGEDDFMRIWQGLFYTLWMSDKLLIQEECVENISSLIHLSKTESALLFFKCGLNTMINKWTGIDQLRLDKFLMFVRRFVRQMMVYLKTHSNALIDEYNKVLEDTILNNKKTVPLGLYLHFCEIYLEELAKVYDSNNTSVVELYIAPFVKHLAFLKDDRQINQIVKNIFRYLFRQSDLGIEYHEKFNAWKKLGFPGKSVHDLVKEEVSDEEEVIEEKITRQKHQNNLDARAGHTDVVLPQLEFDSNTIIDMLEEYKFAQGTCTKSRKAIKKLISEFSLMSDGVYPLGMKPPGLKDKKAPENGLGREAKRKRKVETTESDNEVLTKPKKRKVECADGESFCGMLKKNSGTWFVYEKKPHEKDEKKKTKLKKKANKAINITKKVGKAAITKQSSPKKQKITTPTKTNGVVSSSPVMSPKKLSPKANKVKEVLAKKKLLDNMVADIIRHERVSPRRQPEKGSPKTPKMSPKRKIATPGSSSKKVNINLKLNKSQEISEHYSQIKKSPGIPWDASKKPAKPLLKPFIQSPINPFFKRKYNLK